MAIGNALSELDRSFPVQKKTAEIKGGRQLVDVNLIQAHIERITQEFRDVGVEPAYLNVTVQNIDKILGYGMAYNNWRGGWKPELPGLIVEEAKKKKWNVGKEGEKCLPEIINAAYCISAMSVALSREKQHGKIPDPIIVAEKLSELKGERPVEIPLSETPSEMQRPDLTTPSPSPVFKPQVSYQEALVPQPVEQVKAPIKSRVRTERLKDSNENWQKVVDKLGSVLDVGCTPKESEAVVAAWMVMLLDNLSTEDAVKLIASYKEELKTYGKGMGYFVREKVSQIAGGRLISFDDVDGWQTQSEMQFDEDTRGLLIEIPEEMRELVKGVFAPPKRVQCKLPITSLRNGWMYGIDGRVVVENGKLTPDKKLGDSVATVKESFTLLIGFNGDHRFVIDPVSGTVLKVSAQNFMDYDHGAAVPGVTVDVGE